MTNLDKYLAEVKERCEKSTPGPWAYSIGSDTDGVYGIVGPVNILDSIDSVNSKAIAHLKPFDEVNGTFIAHSKSDIETLLKIVNILFDDCWVPGSTIGKFEKLLEARGK